MLRRREALDGQRVRGERRGADDPDAGQTGQDLAGAVGQQRLELVVDEGDVLAQRLEAVEVAGQPRGAQLGVGGRRQAVLPAARPRTPPSRRSDGRRREPSASGRSGRGPRTRPRRPAPRARSACPAQAPGRGPRGREPGRERVELVMQPLPQRLEREHQLATMRDRREHRVHRRAPRRAPGALAREPDQRRAITIVGLEPPRPELRPRGLSLRRREQPQRPRPAPLELGRPRPMQRARRLQREHRHRRPARPAPQVDRRPLATSATTPAHRANRPQS